MSKAIIFPILILFLFYCSAKQVNPLPKPFEFHGHRGARGNAPENTIPAFRFALENKMNVLEMDTHLTADKKLIVYHDFLLNSKICISKNGSPLEEKPIKDISSTEWKNIDCGSRKNNSYPEQSLFPNTSPPTLDEVLDYVLNYEKGKTEKVKFNIEVKADPRHYNMEDVKEHVKILIDTIQKYKIVDRVIVQSFLIEAIVESKKLLPEIKTSALHSISYTDGLMLYLGFNEERLGNQIIQQTVEAKADYISPYLIYVTPEFVNAAHSKGLRVIPWTVNSKKDIEKMLKAGVDGIISDYPQRIYNAYTIIVSNNDSSSKE